MDAEINGVWSTDLKQFDFDTDMSSTAISRAMSREPWSREYFETLKEYISNWKLSFIFYRVDDKIFFKIELIKRITSKWE